MVSTQGKMHSLRRSILHIVTHQRTPLVRAEAVRDHASRSGYLPLSKSSTKHFVGGPTSCLTISPSPINIVISLSSTLTIGCLVVSFRYSDIGQDQQLARLPLRPAFRSDSAISSDDEPSCASSSAIMIPPSLSQRKIPSRHRTITPIDLLHINHGLSACI